MLPSNSTDLTVILCVFNEKGRLEPAFEELTSALQGRKESVEILIFDNGSTDGTREWLKTLSHPAARVELNERNLGKGGSIKKAIARSRGRYVVIHDPDMEYHAADIWRLLERAQQTQAALVLGSRILSGEIRFKYRINYWGVVILTWMTRILYGCRISDAATAMKLMDGNFARRLKLECDGFDLDFELINRTARLGGTIAESPIDYWPRTVAEGKKIRPWRDGLLALKAILRDRVQPASSFLLSPSQGMK